jgi:extracellular matrix regulatory protein A
MSAEKLKLLNIGFGNSVVTTRVVAIVNPGSSPMRRLREDARTGNRLIDATQGRKTRSLIITDSNHVILSAVQTETITQRLEAIKDKSNE